MGNCGLKRRRKKGEQDEEVVAEVSGRNSQNSYVECKSEGDPTEIENTTTKAMMKVRRPKGMTNLPWIFDGFTLPHSVGQSSKGLPESDTFRDLFRKYIPVSSLKKSVIPFRRDPKAIPYVYAAALGFARLEKVWRRRMLTRRPGMKALRGSSAAPTYRKKVSDDGTIPQEKERWWRYTMFLLVDPLDKETFPRKLAENGGQLVSVESRTGCEIRIGEQKFLYRGNLVRHFFIDGPTQNAIVCCQNSLPQWIFKDIIIDHENCYRKEPLMPEPKLVKLERLGDFTMPREMALVN